MWSKLGFLQVRRALGCGASSANSPGFACTSGRAAVSLPFHTREGAGGCSLSACQSMAVRQYFMFLWQIWYDQLCFPALLRRFVINFFIASSLCPPPLPALCPLIGAPPPSPAQSHSTRHSEFSISTFFFLFPLFCLLVTAFGISRTARTP